MINICLPHQSMGYLGADNGSAFNYRCISSAKSYCFWRISEDLLELFTSFTGVGTQLGRDLGRDLGIWYRVPHVSFSNTNQTRQLAVRWDQDLQSEGTLNKHYALGHFFFFALSLYVKRSKKKLWWMSMGLYPYNLLKGLKVKWKNGSKNF